MGRTAGSRNADFESSRSGLLTRLAERCSAQSSFRELAAAASVTPGTLRHYFQDRDGVLEAVLAFRRAQGAVHLEAAATLEIEDLRESLRWLLEAIAFGWTHGVGQVHGLGLAAGLGSASLGPAYVNEILEPTLQSVEARLARHLARGDLAPCDVRHAALALVSPLILGLLHQQGLFGSRCRPLAIGAFLEDHLDHFLRGYAAKPPARRTPGRRKTRKASPPRAA